jgi:chromosome segregation ATPase
LTASQYLNEANNSKNETNQSMIVKSDEEKEADEALMAMEKVPILQEEIQPLLGQISSGLSGMSKIVGGSTEPRNATAGTLATFMSTTQSNEQDIILPLRELHALVSSRLPYLRSMRENQTQQLDRLNKMIKTLEARIKLTNEKRVTIENNSKLLSQKSADVLETARELTPTITEAEREYFKDIQRFGVNCGKFEETFSELRDTCKALCQGVESAQAEIKIKTQMTEDQKETCKALLEGQKSKLTESEKAIKRVETQMKKFVAEKGMK